MFRCVVNGNGRDDAVIRWMRADGRALPDHALSQADLLVMRRVESTDEGRYICVARTASTRSQAEAELTVSGSSLLPSPPLSVTLSRCVCVRRAAYITY